MCNKSGGTVYVYETFEIKYINVWRRFLLAEGQPGNQEKNKREEEKDRENPQKAAICPQDWSKGKNY